MVRAWNTCVAAREGWSLQPLTEPPIKVATPPWEEFPEGLRRDIDNYLAGLAKSRRSANGKRIHPCSPTTIANRRDELVAFIRMAVRLGFPLKSLTSLTALLNPDVVEKVLDAYWQKNGKEPKTYTIDLGWKLLRMARETGCLDHAALKRLDEISATLEQHRHEGLTQKNLQLIRQVLTDGVWSEVVSLPNALMQAGALGQGSRANQGCGLGAGRCGNCDPYSCADQAAQSHLHRARPESQQTGRAELALLARFPAL